MKHNILPFNHNGVSLTVIADDLGNPEFEVNALCELLGYSNPRDALSRHVSAEDVVKHDTLTAGGKQRKNFLKERGMWRLVMKSNATNADAVQDWIAGEVLPSIRKTGSYTAPTAKEPTGLDKLRIASALEKAEAVASRICARFQRLGESAQQVIFAKIINPIAGTDVLALPRVDEHLLMATELGKELGVSGNMIGRLANKHGLKTEEFGEFRLGKSEFSDKQVEVFHYNQLAADRIRQILSQEGGAA